ncbi:hypothetical protein [Alteraurantiacibacter aquimixticola]|uniref:Lipoprotein n=1 Tax=Alteraurantiacibacter aquimixticola TaxID=2489173 RepID=A0A4T3EXS8_9SPHN|nr:hypothetical protein [Alteraurantiacibacter aquimixticola]TIX49439.1 hypothetical protein E5222_11320 [Alteraurantiacibacter aquimixticola]
MIGRFLVAALMALSLASCGDDAFPDYHYKMTVYVGGQAFSSVRAVEQEEVSSVVDSTGRTVKTSMRGEAVIIDHPNGRTYYALIGKSGSPQYGAFAAELALMPLVTKAQSASTDNWTGENQSGDLDLRARDHQAMVAIEGPQELRRRVPVDELRRHSGSGDPDFPAWPMFVTFSDPADPRTVREVSPDSLGVERITIEITDEDVTTGIEERLGWLSRLGGGYLSGRGTAVGSPYGLSGSAFSEGNGI